MLPISYLCNIHLDFGICQEFSHVHSAHVLCVTGVPRQLQETAGSHSIFWIFLRNPKKAKTNKSACITCCSWINLLLNHQAQEMIKMKNQHVQIKNYLWTSTDFFFPFYLLSLASLREIGKCFWKGKVLLRATQPETASTSFQGQNSSHRGLDNLHEPCQCTRVKVHF